MPPTSYRAQHRPERSRGMIAHRGDCGGPSTSLGTSYGTVAKSGDAPKLSLDYARDDGERRALEREVDVAAEAAPDARVVDIVRGRDVPQRDAERFKQSDLIIARAAGNFAGNDVAQQYGARPIPRRPLAPQEADRPTRSSPAPRSSSATMPARRTTSGSISAEVARFEPAALTCVPGASIEPKTQRLGRAGHRSHHLRFPDGGGDVGSAGTTGMPNSAVMSVQNFCVCAGLRPMTKAAIYRRSRTANRLELRARLPTGTENRHLSGIFARHEARREAGRRAGADLSQLITLDQREHRGVVRRRASRRSSPGLRRSDNICGRCVRRDPRP